MGRGTRAALTIGEDVRITSSDRFSGASNGAQFSLTPKGHRDARIGSHFNRNRAGLGTCLGDAHFILAAAAVLCALLVVFQPLWTYLRL